MGFWIFMLVCVLITPLIMIILGNLYQKGHYPKKINDFSGYRTELSMKNQKTWEFAQEQMGKVWFITGMSAMLPSVVPMLFVIGGEPEKIGGAGGCIVMAQIIVMTAVIMPIENAIKKKFPEFDNKKS